MWRSPLHCRGFNPRRPVSLRHDGCHLPLSPSPPGWQPGALQIKPGFASCTLGSDVSYIGPPPSGGFHPGPQPRIPPAAPTDHVVGAPECPPAGNACSVVAGGAAGSADLSTVRFDAFLRGLLAYRAFFLNSAHRFLWAAAIRFLAARLSLDRGLAGAWAVAARFFGGGRSRLRTWAICWSTRWRWDSRPSSAAWRTAGSNRFPRGMRCTTKVPFLRAPRRFREVASFRRRSRIESLTIESLTIVLIAASP